VGYLELMIAPAFSYHGIASDSADDQLVVGNQYLDLFRSDTREVEFDLPPFRTSIYIDSRLPQRTARAAVFAADSFDENSFASRHHSLAPRRRSVVLASRSGLNYQRPVLSEQVHPLHRIGRQF